MSWAVSAHRRVADLAPIGQVRPRRGWPAHVVDAAFALAALAASLVLLGHDSHLEPTQVALVAASTTPLLLWRRAPLPVFVIATCAGVLLAAQGSVIWPPLGPAAALYLLARSRPDALPWTLRSAATVIALLIAYLVAAVAAGAAQPDVLHTGLVCAVAWFAGERARLRREQLDELRHRADRAEAEAVRERQLAVAEERARIARDLHDSAGHALNVIAVRAGAARLRHGEDPDRELVALTAIEDLARQTVTDIDRFVGTLRADDGDEYAVECPVGLASVDDLVAQHRAAGLDVILERVGTGRDLGTAADQTAYRTLQEALTNAARYGVGRTQVSIAYTDREVHVAVANPVGAHSRPATVRGHGLIGMGERAALLGGELTTELQDGVFRVLARIPDTGSGE